MGLIYKIINDVNDKIYIGQTTQSLNKRWNNHKYDAFYKKQLGYNMIIHKAMRKYGIEHFQIAVIEECDNSILNEREKYWIEYYNSTLNGYNCSKGGKPFSEQENLSYRLKTNLNTILDLYSQGYNQIEIAEKLGCSRTSILNKLKANGISNPQGWERCNIGQYDSSNNLIKVFSSMHEASRETGICYSGINRCVNNKQNFAGGYKWKRLKNI